MWVFVAVVVVTSYGSSSKAVFGLSSYLFLSSMYFFFLRPAIAAEHGLLSPQS